MGIAAMLLLAANAYLVDIQLGPLSYQISPRPMGFGVVACGVDSVQKLSIDNTGRPDIVVMGRSYSGSPRFSVTNDGSGSWPAGPGASHHVTVIFHPLVPKRAERGTITLHVEYHDQQIAAERNRIRGLMDPEINQLEAKLAQLKQAGPAIDIIDTLKLKADIDRQKRVNAISAEISRDRSKVFELEQEKIRVMQEYREGAFCSGCGKTRSQIEAEGSTFPHPGQHIVAATPQQLAQKEAEYNQKIAAAAQRASGHQLDLQQAEATFQQKIQELDRKRDTLRAMWEADVARLTQEIAQLKDRRRRLLAKLDEMANYRETQTIGVEGSCNDAK